MMHEDTHSDFGFLGRRRQHLSSSLSASFIKVRKTASAAAFVFKLDVFDKSPT
jgi:hypothetical protein